MAASAATSCAAVTPDPQYTATGPSSVANRSRSAWSGRNVPSPSSSQAVGNESAPGMCPACGSTGSTSPRKRSAARASSSDPSHAAAASASIVGSSPSVEHDVARLGDDLAGLQRARPRAQTAVEQPDVAQSRPSQQPPRAGRGHAADGVVGDDRAARGHAPAACGGLQAGGERVAAVLGAGRRRQLGLEVHVDRTRQVPREVAGVPVGLAERPAHVEQHRPPRAGELGREHLGGHEHVVSVGHDASPRRSSRMVHASMLPGW